MLNRKICVWQFMVSFDSRGVKAPYVCLTPPKTNMEPENDGF